MGSSGALFGMPGEQYQTGFMKVYKGDQLEPERPNSDLPELLKRRDDHFHPFNGLKGDKIYLLYRSSKENQIGKRAKVWADRKSRVEISSYIDRSFLLEKIKQVKYKKDDVIIITDDDTLREAQEVGKKFDGVYILNITDRKNVTNEIKVIAHNSIDKIF